MSSEVFSDVRRTPQGREAIFTPEILLDREFAESKVIEKPKSQKREESISEIVNKLNLPAEHTQRISDLISRVRHSDDMDLYVLAIASYLFIRFNDPNRLQQANMDEMRQFVAKIPQDTSSKSSSITSNYGKDVENKLLADVLAYYYMVHQSALP